MLCSSERGTPDDDNDESIGDEIDDEIGDAILLL